MESSPTGTVTFLLTDIEGSTRRWQDEPEAMRAGGDASTSGRRAMAGHDRIVIAADLVRPGENDAARTIGHHRRFRGDRLGRRSSSGVVDSFGDRRSDGSNCCQERRYVVTSRRQGDVEVYRPIAVHDSVPQVNRITPSNVTVFGPGRVRELSDRFAQHREVPQQCITPVSVDCEILRRPPGREVDHTFASGNDLG